MKKQILLFVCFSLILTISVSWAQDNDYKIIVKKKPNFRVVEGIIQPDTFSLGFNIVSTDQTKRVTLGNPQSLEFELEEKIGDKPEKAPEFVAGSLKVLKVGGGNTKVEIPKDITVSLLVDRSGSIDTREMQQIKDAVRAFVENPQLPQGSIYFSWFHNDVSSSIPIDKNTFDKANFDTTNFDTDLYNAISIKLDEFELNRINENALFEKGYQKNETLPVRASSDSLNNYLIVLTDGKNDIHNATKYLDKNIKPVSLEELEKRIMAYNGKIKIYALGYGENSGDFDEEALKRICIASQNPNGYYLAQPDKILELFKTTLVEELAVDYEALFANPKFKTYYGQKRDLVLKITDKESGITASGGVVYSLGSPNNPIVSGEKTETGRTLLNGLLVGVIFLVVVLIIIQLIWPLLKNVFFNIRYVKKYKAAPNEIKKTCPYCLEEIIPGQDKIVVKCHHVVHKQCWETAGYMCPEYGQNCNTGKQDYFDISDPFSKRNKAHYLNWVLFGLIGGLLTWILYTLIKDSGLFTGLSTGLINTFVSGMNDETAYFIDKISPLFIIGILMGFFLTLFFAYAEEYRRISFAIFGLFVLRAVIGAIVGFLTFFVGIIILLLFKDPYTNIWIDWIPWLLFGALIGVSLSVKTTIALKHGLLGGIISIIFSFIVLYGMTPNLGALASVICFMLYGAGLGASIATVRSSSEHYFVKILNGTKQGSMIAVHKWMNASGGLNEVYLGKSNVCEIQINWEKGFEIAEKHAKLFINKTRKIPVIVSLVKGKSTMYNERIDMTTGKEYDLLNGVTFKIGETLFQYVEKDK